MVRITGAGERNGQFLLVFSLLLCWYARSHIQRDVKMTMNNDRQFIETIAREAGELLRKRLDNRHTIHFKGEINLVTEADRFSEALIKARIRKAFPGHDILSEESPETSNGSRFRWIIDPLDGTTNYAHGYPVFCVSIALEVEGTIRLGVVYDPVADELFVAEKGEGAFLNGRRLAVSRIATLKRGLLATGFPYDIREDRNNNMNFFKAMAMNAQAVRRAGSAALDLAYVAAGRFDGFWELKLMPWDTAAGWLLVSEAGGAVTDLRGGSYGLRSPNILASNGLIHEEMVHLLIRTDPLDAQ
jgi:myo-inositol-1(or 4)-monophosphatase